MASLCRSLFSAGKILNSSSLRRNISLSSTSNIKQIIEKQEGNTLVVSGKIVPDPAESRLIKPANNGSCPLCSLGLEVKHTDVLIISQFLRPDGCVLPKRITGLCTVQQRRLQTMVAMAQKAGLMSNLTPGYSHKDPKKRSTWKKYNMYFDDSTIKRQYKDITFRERIMNGY